MVLLLTGLVACQAGTAITPPATVVPLPATTATLAPDDVLVLSGDTLIDGTGTAAVLDTVIVIRQGLVEAAGPRAGVVYTADARVIDVQGTTILPGFINAHVHEAIYFSLAVWVSLAFTQAPVDSLEEDLLITSKKIVIEH
jgi:imidazolonepropionase-like amidohydrolase